MTQEIRHRNEPLLVGGMYGQGTSHYLVTEHLEGFTLPTVHLRRQDIRAFLIDDAISTILLYDRDACSRKCPRFFKSRHDDIFFIRIDVSIDTAALYHNSSQSIR